MLIINNGVRLHVAPGNDVFWSDDCVSISPTPAIKKIVANDTIEKYALNTQPSTIVDEELTQEIMEEMCSPLIDEETFDEDEETSDEGAGLSESEKESVAFEAPPVVETSSEETSSEEVVMEDPIGDAVRSIISSKPLPVRDIEAYLKRKFPDDDFAVNMAYAKVMPGVCRNNGYWSVPWGMKQ